MKRDQELEELWKDFADIMLNEDCDCIDEDFHIWKKKTQLIEIWGWFDEIHSKGVGYLVDNVFPHED